MTASESSFAKQYAKHQKLDDQAHALWDKLDRETRRLIRMAKIGRKARAVIPISETRGVEIRNQFRGEDKVFAPAFARKWKLKEIPLDNE